MNSGATFTRMVRKVLCGLSNVDSYIDDILIYTETWEEHVKVLNEVLDRIQRAGLTIKVSKCMFGFEEVEYVGHNIGKSQIGMVSATVDKIENALRPKTKKALRSFVGLTNYYRKHIPNFSQIAVPLTDLTKKSKPNVIQWGDEQEAAFMKLKTMLISKPILQMPDWKRSFLVQVDASDMGLGAVLLQEHDGDLLPVAFASRKLLPREVAYSIVEKECLAVVWAIQKFKMYLYGREFKLQTDHQALVSMNRGKVANDRVTRWSLVLQQYRMRIESIKGSQNVIADYLSRLSG